MTNIKNILRSSGSLFVIGSFLFVLPANAATRGSVDTEGNVIDSKGQIVGHIVKETTIQPDVYFVTIDSRRNELEKVIGKGMATGKLTQAQADGLRQELDGINQQLLSARKLGLATPYYEQMAVVAVRLDGVGQTLNEAVGYSLVPIVENGRFVVFNGQIVQLDEIATRRSELEQKISLALVRNALTSTQASDLRTQLNVIAVREVQIRGGDRNGEFTNKEAKQLFTSFDQVGSDLDQDISGGYKGKPVATASSTGTY
jgi:hypothetical protein